MVGVPAVADTGAPATLCLWADEYAAGIIYFFYGAAVDAERLLPQARAEIEAEVEVEVEVDKNR